MQSSVPYQVRRHVGDNLTTFDSKEELDKIKKWHPQCALLIRVKVPDDSRSRCPLGAKFGALPEEIVPLLQAAQVLRLTVTGVSFHIGSGAMQFRAYREAIAAAKIAFETSARLGMPKMHVLNIGGGFTAGSQFKEAASTVKAALRYYFPNEPGLIIMDEPVRFFAEKDHPTCKAARNYDSTVFGPTCDAIDTVMKGYRLPELNVDYWLVFPNMGAYRAAAGTSFNGFNTSDILTYLAYSN
ncbi:Ornithine decarboxylase [Hibiscus syriacus]|uniref:Ornithine decarboxylase n=1 Tax=Hibiscus syriacus TaxID=106335 RepID=A0A6A3BXN9_HIBSY|nr:Ornithine decarboxylase [Hibiscus syriacus]